MSKVKQQQLDQNFNNGWLSIGAITRVSDTTATLVGDWTDRIQKVDKLWWKSNGSSRWNYILAVSYSAGTGLTTITISSLYTTTANDARFESGHTLTAPYISHEANPIGFSLINNASRVDFANASADYTTNSTSLTYMDQTNGKATMQVIKGSLIKCALTLQGIYNNTNGYDPAFNIGLDGLVTVSSSGNQSLITYLASPSIITSRFITLEFYFKNVTPGSHDFYPLWLIGSGNVYAYRYARQILTLEEIF